MPVALRMEMLGCESCSDVPAESLRGAKLVIAFELLLIKASSIQQAFELDPVVCCICVANLRSTGVNKQA